MSLMDKILSLNTTRPTEQQLTAPRTYRRRATWIPVAGEKVTVWRMGAYDPDSEESYPGVFVTSSDTSWTVLVDGEQIPEPFAKRDTHGGTNWFLASRGSTT